MKNLFYNILLLFITSGSIFAQDKILYQANKSYKNSQFSKAISLYEQVLSGTSDKKDRYISLGNTYFFNKDFEKASNWYSKLLDEYPTYKNPLTLRRYSYALNAIGEYNKASIINSKVPQQSNASEDALFKNYGSTSTSSENKKEINTVQVYINLGNIYFFYRDFENASLWYSKVVGEYPSFKDPLVLERFSYALNALGKYSDAFLIDSKIPQNPEFSEVTLFKNYSSSQQYEGAVNSLKLNNSGNFTVTECDFTPKVACSNPMLSIGSQELIYSSKESKVDKRNDKFNNQPFSELYSYNFEKERSIKLPRNINTGFHEMNAVMSPTKDTIYFTRGFPLKLYEKRPNSEGMLLKLYFAVKRKGKWSKPRLLPFNDNRSSTGYPSLSYDGKTLYFSSDRAKGYGGFDIYKVAILGARGFGKPENVGDKINTSGNELTPFVDHSKLYFASDGHLGLGGLDLFVINLRRLNAMKPLNLGLPVNSSYDDRSFTFDSNSRTGYLASNRPLDKDTESRFSIYKCRQTQDLVTDCQQWIKGVVTNAETRKLITNCKISVFDQRRNKLGDYFSDDQGNINIPIECDTSNFILIEKEGYSSAKETIDADTSNKKVINKSFEIVRNFLVENSIEEEVSIKGEEVSLPSVDLSDVLNLSKIYFKSGSSQPTKSSIGELDKVYQALKERPSLRISVRSYTDNQGSESGNLQLSRNRSNYIKKYLIQKGGISSSRIEALGFGESNPYIDCKDNCTDYELEQNRRTEFFIIK